MWVLNPQNYLVLGHLRLDWEHGHGDGCDRLHISHGHEVLWELNTLFLWLVFRLHLE